MKKKFQKIGYFCILFSVIVFIVFFGIIFINRKSILTRNDFHNLQQKADKVILFIGDGMGENHIEIGKKYLNQKMVFESFRYQGYMTTFSNAIFSPTDSAASATAMATGQKVDNGEISKHQNKNLLTISEYAKNLKKGVGIVTTDSLTGATPACFSSHAKSRHDKEDIIKGQINSNIDMFLGAGYDDYLSYQKQLENNRYLFTNHFNRLTIKEEKIFGCFKEVANYNHQNETPTLVNLVAFAIDFMESKYPTGYFLMIESAHIDKMSHQNEIFKMIEYLDEFNSAIQYAYERLSKNSDTAFIVTADHETGNLLNFTGTKEEVSNKLYRRKNHSRKKVKFFLQLPLDDDSLIIPFNIDNTDIYKICYQLIS